MKTTSKKGPGAVDRDIGARIRKHRKAISMSQEALGREIGGLSFQQVQKYENGKNRVTVARLLAIAEVLGVPYAVLIPGDETRLRTTVEALPAIRRKVGELNVLLGVAR